MGIDASAVKVAVIDTGFDLAGYERVMRAKSLNVQKVYGKDDQDRVSKLLATASWETLLDRVVAAQPTSTKHGRFVMTKLDENRKSMGKAKALDRLEAWLKTQGLSREYRAVLEKKKAEYEALWAYQWWTLF